MIWIRMQRAMCQATEESSVGSTRLGRLVWRTLTPIQARKAGDDLPRSLLCGLKSLDRRWDPEVEVLEQCQRSVACLARPPWCCWMIVQWAVGFSFSVSSPLDDTKIMMQIYTYRRRLLRGSSGFGRPLSSSHNRDAFFEDHATGTFWVRTGDSGYMDNSGRLHVIGRYKDMYMSFTFSDFTAFADT